MKIKVCFFLSLLVLFSCSKKDAIVGEWRLEKMNIEKAISEFTPEQKEFARFMIGKAFEMVKGKMKMTFSEDKKFAIEIPLQNGKTEKKEGTWRISKNGKKLTIVTNGETEVNQILKLKGDELCLEMEQPGMGKMEMTFIRNSP